MKNSRIKMRARIISYIYSYLVLDKTLDGITAFESGNYSDQEIKIIEVISKNFNNYKKIVESFLKKGWLWSRINPLEKAILIYGAFELNISDKALVINELIVITRGYIPGDTYKFINGILNKIGEFYEKRN